MVVVVEEKLVVLPLEWQVEGVLQVGQTGQVEEVEHHNQNLKHEESTIHVKRDGLTPLWLLAWL